MTGAAQPWRGHDPGDRAVYPKRDIGDGGFMTLGGMCPIAAFSCPQRQQRVVLKGLKAPPAESSPATTTPPRTVTSPVTTMCHLPATTPRPHHCAGRTAEEPCRQGTNHEGTEDPCGDWSTLALLLSLSTGQWVLNKGGLVLSVDVLHGCLRPSPH